jgi:hypothetical protein
VDETLRRLAPLTGIGAVILLVAGMVIAATAIRHRSLAYLGSALTGARAAARRAKEERADQ